MFTLGTMILRNDVSEDEIKDCEKKKVKIYISEIVSNKINILLFFKVIDSKRIVT